MNNNWDKLSSKFDVHKSELGIDPGAADNILIAWPPIIDLIIQYFDTLQVKKLKALDYGCGTGGFAQKLDSLGFDVVGTDISEDMLRIAKKSTNKKIIFLKTDRIPQNAKYDLITGIMVFQFIQNAQEVFEQLISRLRKGGLIVFAVFNPKFVTLCLKSQILFSNFDTIDDPKIGVTIFGKDSNIPTFIKSANEYDKMLNNFGLTKKLEVYPQFTKEYLNKYPVDTPTNESEYLILGYCRS